MTMAGLTNKIIKMVDKPLRMELHLDDFQLPVVFKIYNCNCIVKSSMHSMVKMELLASGVPQGSCLDPLMLISY